MDKDKRRAATLGLVFGSAVALALAGCATSDERPRESGAYYEAAEPGDSGYVEIRAEGDFYEPLSPYGRWEIVGSYGRCWIPERVEADWSPYADGYWRRTEGGWYWESEEPWGWATYHYGRWDSDPQFGWYWVPQTRWAPAWVSWRHGGGYTGWAPLGPTGRAGGEHDRRRAASGGYVFVEDRQFLEPVRHRTVVVNNTVINRTVINEAPSTVVIEKASGRKVQTTPGRELRHKEEATAVAKHPALAVPAGKRVESPVRPKPKTEAVRSVEPKRVAKPVVEKPAPKPESRPMVKDAAPKVAPPATAVRKKPVRSDEPAHVVKPVAEQPVQPDQMRAPPQKQIQPAPAPLPTKAPAKRTIKPKPQREVKVAPIPAVEPPPPNSPPPEKRRSGTDNEKDDEGGENGRGRHAP